VIRPFHPFRCLAAKESPIKRFVTNMARVFAMSRKNPALSPTEPARTALPSESDGDSACELFTLFLGDESHVSAPCSSLACNCPAIDGRSCRNGFHA